MLLVLCTTIFDLSDNVAIRVLSELELVLS
jgi:hypothetical protein